MTSIPTFAPGCFGSALAFDEAAPVCTVCRFAAECRPMHEANLAALRQRLGVDMGRVRAKVKEDKHETGLVISKQAQKIVDDLDASNLRVTEKLARGENPFGNDRMMLKLAAHILLKCGYVEREALSYALQTRMEWAPSTASLRAINIMQAFTHIGAADLIDGKLFIRRG